MLNTSDRVRPCNALCAVSSEARFTLSVLSFFSTVMPAGRRCISSPLGPFTFTVFPSTVTATPFGTATGSLPIRDIANAPLPDDGDELAAGARLARFTVRHQAFGRA